MNRNRCECRIEWRELLANGLQSLLAGQFARLQEPGGIRDDLFWV
jgi:hypothetical protein